MYTIDGYHSGQKKIKSVDELFLNEAFSLWMGNIFTICHTSQDSKHWKKTRLRLCNLNTIGPLWNWTIFSKISATECWFLIYCNPEISQPHKRHTKQTKHISNCKYSTQTERSMILFHSNNFIQNKQSHKFTSILQFAKQTKHNSTKNNLKMFKNYLNK